MLIKRITDHASLRELYKFRKEVLVQELGYLSSQESSLRDEYDDFAHNYAAWDQSGKIMGSIRLVVDGPLGLPVERLCVLNGHRENNRLAEACRLAIAKDYRSSRLFIKLIAAAYQCALLIKSLHLVLDNYLNEEPLYQRLGFQRISEPYSDPVSNRNAKVVAMMVGVNRNTISLIPNKAIQEAILSTQSNEINHGTFTKKRTIIEEFPVYKSRITA